MKSNSLFSSYVTTIFPKEIPLLCYIRKNHPQSCRCQRQSNAMVMDNMENSALLELLRQGIQYTGKSENWEVKYEVSGDWRTSERYYLSHRMAMEYKGKTSIERFVYEISGGIFTLSSGDTCEENTSSFQFSANVQTRPPQQWSELAQYIKIQWKNGLSEVIAFNEMER